MAYMDPETGQLVHSIKKISWWHESIVDWELANPHLTMNDCASYFNVSPSYLSTLRNSDTFRAYAMKRRQEHNETVSSGLVVQLGELANDTVGFMLEKVKNERESLDFSQVKEAAALALKALGFGQGQMGNPNRVPDRSGNNVTNNFNFNGASPEILARARERMRLINQPSTNIIVIENEDQQEVVNA